MNQRNSKLAATAAAESASPAGGEGRAPAERLETARFDRRRGARRGRLCRHRRAVGLGRRVWSGPARTRPGSLEDGARPQRAAAPLLHDERGPLAAAGIPRSDVDPRYLDVLLAYEDKRFFEHGGVDPLAMGRAALQLLTNGHIVSGGSTITMQVARLIEPRRERLALREAQRGGARHSARELRSARTRSSPAT